MGKAEKSWRTIITVAIGAALAVGTTAGFVVGSFARKTEPAAAVSGDLVDLDTDEDRQMFGMTAVSAGVSAEITVAMCEYVAARIAARGVTKGPRDGPWTAPDVMFLIYDLQGCWSNIPPPRSKLDLTSACGVILNRAGRGESRKTIRDEMCRQYKAIR